MFRDKAPLTNLGYGITSRDISATAEEQKRPSPDSGFISRALDDKPIIKFISTMALTLGASMAVSRVTSKGGVKLAKTIQQSADSGNNRFTRTFVETAAQIRRTLDELEGLNRYVEGYDDPYGRLVYERPDGSIIQPKFTPLNGPDFVSDGTMWMTRKEFLRANAGQEPVAEWGFRDELQRNLVRGARQLPVMLPSTYFVQRGFIDKTMGEEERDKVNWFNPVDVFTDFVKQSTKNIATLLLPEAGLRSTASRIKQLASAPYADYPLPIGRKQMKTANRIADIKQILVPFGQDFGELLGKAQRISNSASYAFGQAFNTAQDLDTGPAFAMHQARRGRRAAMLAHRNGQTGRLDAAQQFIMHTKGLGAQLFGYKNKSESIPIDLEDATLGIFGAGERTMGLVDALIEPKAFISGTRAFFQEFRRARSAQEFMAGTISWNETLRRYGGDINASATILNKTVSNLKRQHSSRFANLVRDSLNARQVIGDDGEVKAPGSSIYQFEVGAYQATLEDSLIRASRNSITREEAKEFVSGIGVERLLTPMDRRRNISERVTYGIKKIIAQDDEDFFNQISTRIKEDLGEDQGAKFTRQILQNAFRETDRRFTNPTYRNFLRERANLAFREFEKNVLIPQVNALSKPMKILYQDYVGDLGAEKMDFLARKTAQKLGVRLVNPDGSYSSRAFIRSELSKRGIDSTDASQLRSFLVQNKVMTPAYRGGAGGFNIFGLREISVDEAAGYRAGEIAADDDGPMGLFDAFGADFKSHARYLLSRVAQEDPVSRTIGFSRLDGVYKTASGRIVDTTKVKSGLHNMMNNLAEGYGLPIVKFNPLQLLGFGGPRGVSDNTEIKFISGYSRQDFLNRSLDRPDVYAWVNQRRGIFGSSGKVFSLRVQDAEVAIDEQFGAYKRFSSVETDLYSRMARLGSGRGKQRAASRTNQSTGMLDRIRTLFDVDEEQPGSILRRIGRFKNRKVDINNPLAFSRLFDIDESGGLVSKNSRMRVVESGQGGFSVVDEAGRQVYSEEELTKAFVSFRQQQTQGRGFARPVMKLIGERLGDVPKVRVGSDELSIDEVMDKDLPEAFPSIERLVESVIADQRARGIDSTGLTRGLNFVRNLMKGSNFLANELIKHRSPTINTRQDYLRNAIFKLLVQTRGYTTGGGDPARLAIDLEEAITSLKASGQISAQQATEAKAAGLEMVFDMFSYKNYNPRLQFGFNQRQALRSIISTRNTEAAGDPQFARALAGLFQPFTSQQIANVEAAGSGRIMSLIRPALRRQFTHAPYELQETAVNPLGNYGTTLVPTFQTVLERAVRGQVPMRSVISSVLGGNSYSSPDTFSSASIPAMHGFDRLNRYIESTGLGLDTDAYSSPVGFFVKGLIGKRVLPLYLGGTGLMTVDRTIGGYTQEKDERGERVYSPFVMTKLARGAVEVQSAFSGLTPGGMDYEEKKQQLMEGEVPVRQGRYWPLGVTPFMGSKVQYFRPSYYRRLESGSTYTSDAFGSPIERFAFGYDFSPLRPFDPYRFEREQYHNRPFPVTGEYFTGPFGPVTPLLNMTLGRVLKPQKMMHEEEVSNALSSYVPVGYSGAYDPSGLLSSGRVTPIFTDQNTFDTGKESGTFTSSAPQSSLMTGLQIASRNKFFETQAAPLNTARNLSTNAIASANREYGNYSLYGRPPAGNQPPAFPLYGPPPVPGYIPPQIVPAGTPITTGSMQFQGSEFGYRMQEMAGIYGFGFASLREGLGLGDKDLLPNKTVLQSASKAYGMGRSFWDLNLGGLGDFPASESSLELSEIARRFIPKERSNINYLNPIRNRMGMEYPFLPGSDYFINFQTGDPFSKIQEGELRLPGVAYERLNPNRRDYNDPVTQLDILADVAPYSRQFRELNRTIDIGNMSPEDRGEVEKIRAQVEQVTQRNQFRPYKYKYSSPEELNMGRVPFQIAKMGEYLAHRDTFINTKFVPHRTAQEDWERRNVYGSSFPEWSSPIESFIQPIYYRATQRNPILAGLITGGIGTSFGKGGYRERAIGGFIGFTTGFAASAYANTKELLTGERFIPKDRRKQMALEEYTDILSYVKNRSLAMQAAESGDMEMANQFSRAAKRTMYGADIYGASVETLSLAVPKRKREHFKEMINAPVEERERILSTAPRLERRIYQAAWGMKVEEKPDLVDYFSRHELPDMSWEGWHPNTNIDHVKIKIGQSMGINMSQMGYYPQQIKEANLSNPSYPAFGVRQDKNSVAARLRMLMSRNGITGSVTPVSSFDNQSSINISAGVF